MKEIFLSSKLEETETIEGEKKIGREGNISVFNKYRKINGDMTSMKRMGSSKKKRNTQNVPFFRSRMSYNKI